MSLPEELRYTSEHEWVRTTGDTVRVGITDFAQDQLGDVVYVELPNAGAHLEANQPFGVVESVKAASDLYSPLTGKVVALNDRLLDQPELVNSDPYGEGWMLELAPANPSDVEALMDAQAYRRLVEDGG